MEAIKKVDWNERYVQADTPWDSGVPSEALKNIVGSGVVKPCRVLELGCGTGTNAVYLAKQGFDVTAVDLSSVAIERAKERARQAGVSVKFVQADVTNLPDLGKPFSFVFDRGTYHIVRHVNLKGMQKTLETMVEPGGYFLVLAGNSNETGPDDKGPPRVTPQDLCAELEFDSFNLISLEQTVFHGVAVDGEQFTPLAWKALLRRRDKKR